MSNRKEGQPLSATSNQTLARFVDREFVRKVRRQEVFARELQIFATTIPKVGNTAIRSFLIGAEAWTRHSIGECLPDQVSIEEFTPQGVSVHSDPKFIDVSRSPRRLPHGVVCVLVLRDPVDRFLSMWVDKFLLMQHGGLLPDWLSRDDWFPQPFEGLVAARTRLMRLIEALRDPNLLYSDLHWAPQHAFVRAGLRYDIVLDLKELNGLPERLAAQRASLLWLRDQPMIRRHESNATLQELLVTEEIAEEIRNLYLCDLDLREQFGLPTEAQRVLDQVTAVDDAVNTC